MATFADLEGLIGIPTKPAPDNDWQSIEADLGLILPADYKELMERYPNLELGAPLGPYIPNPGCYPESSMRDLVLGMLDELGPLEDEDLRVVDDDKNVIEVCYFMHYPDPNGLIPWGSTENGQIFLWEAAGEANEWRVCISDGTFFWRHDKGLIDYLVQSIMGNIRCPLLANNGALEPTKREYAREDLASGT